MGIEIKMTDKTLSELYLLHYYGEDEQFINDQVRMITEIVTQQVEESLKKMRENGMIGEDRHFNISTQLEIAHMTKAEDTTGFSVKFNEDGTIRLKEISETVGFDLPQIEDISEDIE